MARSSQQPKRKRYLPRDDNDAGYGSDDDDDSSSGGNNRPVFPTGSSGSKNDPPSRSFGQGRSKPATDISSSTQRADPITIDKVVTVFTFPLPTPSSPSTSSVVRIRTITAVIQPTTSTAVSSTPSSSSVSPPHTRLDASHSPATLPSGAVRATLNIGAIFAIVLGISTLVSITVCCLLYRAKIRRTRKARLESISYGGQTISSFEPAEYTGTPSFRFPSTMHRSLKSCVTLPSFFIFGSPAPSNADLDATISPALPDSALIPSRSSNRWTRSTYDQLLSPLSFNILLDDSQSEYASSYDDGVEDLPQMEFVGSTATHSVENAKHSSFGTNTCSAHHTRTKSILKPGALDAPLPPLPTSSKSIKWVKVPF